MATKAELERRIAVLERREENSLAAFDALSEARGLRGVRVVGDWTGGDWSILVIGSEITEQEEAMKLAGIFRHALEMCRYVMLHGSGGLTDGAESGGA